MQLGIYKHYKGDLFNIIGVARHSERDEALVIYHYLDGTPGLWARPLSMFQEIVTFQGEEVPRFKYQEPFLTEAPEFIDPDWKKREALGKR